MEVVRCYQAKMHSTKLPVSDRWKTCQSLCKNRPSDQSGSLTTFMTSAGGTNTYVITSNRLEKSWTLDWKCWLNTLLSKIYFIISVRSHIIGEVSLGLFYVLNRVKSKILFHHQVLLHFWKLFHFCRHVTQAVWVKSLASPK